ncbi:MAG: DUF192 domain-containing protein [bacterium]
MTLAKKNIFLLAVAIIIVIFFIVKNVVVSREKFIIINNKEIKAEIADTPELKYKGLSNRDYLCEYCGMLFLFNDMGERIFVMREMKFNLDIIWIEDDKIVKIDKDLHKEGINPKEIYSSGQAVDKVLEVNANFCDKNNIKFGDNIIF